MRIARYVCLTLAFIVMVTAALTYAAPHLGWRVNVVSESAMEPALKEGSVTVVRPVAPEDIETGDIIHFIPTYGGKPMTRRVITLREGYFRFFTTKGDANAEPDPDIVFAENVIGVVCLHLPGLSGLVRFMNSTPGFFICLILPAVILILLFIWSNFFSAGSSKE